MAVRVNKEELKQLFPYSWATYLILPLSGSTYREFPHFANAFLKQECTNGLTRLIAVYLKPAGIANLTKKEYRSIPHIKTSWVHSYAIMDQPNKAHEISYIVSIKDEHIYDLFIDNRLKQADDRYWDIIKKAADSEHQFEVLKAMFTNIPVLDNELQALEENKYKLYHG